MEKSSEGENTLRVASAAKERTGEGTPVANGLELWPGRFLPRISEKKVETKVHNGCGSRWGKGKRAFNGRV